MILKNLTIKADVKNVENSVTYASKNIQNLHTTFHRTTIAVTTMTMTTMAMTTVIIIIITTTMINLNLSCKYIQNDAIEII